MRVYGGVVDAERAQLRSRRFLRNFIEIGGGNARVRFLHEPQHIHAESDRHDFSVHAVFLHFVGKELHDILIRRLDLAHDEAVVDLFEIFEKLVERGNIVRHARFRAVVVFGHFILTQLFQRHMFRDPLSVGRALERGIVQYENFAVFGNLHIDLHGVRARLIGGDAALQSVFRITVRHAAVRDIEIGARNGVDIVIVVIMIQSFRLAVRKYAVGAAGNAAVKIELLRRIGGEPHGFETRLEKRHRFRSRRALR